VYQSNQEVDGQYKISVTKNMMSLNKMKQEYTDLMNKESAYAKKDKKEIVFLKKMKPGQSPMNEHSQTYGVSSSVSPERDSHLKFIDKVNEPEIKIKKPTGYYHYHNGRVSRDSSTIRREEPPFYIGGENHSQVTKKI
jgi:hypothetical protein